MNSSYYSPATTYYPHYYSPYQLSPDPPSKSRHNSKRQGDWICSYCSNYNYSFRLQCNRCQMDPKVFNYETEEISLHEPKIKRRQSIWKIDENMKNQDPMRKNCFGRMLFLTPPKGGRRESLRSRRDVMGVIQNNKLKGKEKEEEKENCKENYEEEILKWVSKLIDQ